MCTRFSFPLLLASLLVTQTYAADSNTEKTHKLIAVLQSNAPFFDKARACQQLGEFGTPEAVPALAAQLADEHLSAYARSGLEGIPDPSAAQALREATSTLKGKPLAGAINSLGVLRDAQGVGLLRKFAEDPRSGVATQALLALGRISTDESNLVIRQALSQGPDATRAAAAAACLQAAEEQSSDGHAKNAVALYDAVRAASVSMVYRAAATRGAIVARKRDGIPLLIEQLRSENRVLRNVALHVIREMPSEQLAGALNAELDRAPAELQVQLLTALIDCHNAASLTAIEPKATSDDSEVRKAALRALGRIGDARATAVLLKAATNDQRANEATIALDSLEGLRGAPVDEQIVGALASTSSSAPHIKLIRLLETRGATTASSELLKQAAGSDTKASIAALRALKSLAGPAQVGALINLVKSAKDDTVREAAENAVVGACGSAAATTASDAVLAELQQASEPVLKNSWVKVLVSLGYPKALPAILRCLNDSSELVVANAITQLARWPDPEPIEPLLALVQKTTDAARRNRALASAIKLAAAAAEAHQRPDATVVKWLQTANQTTQAVEDRRLIISGLGHLKVLDSFRLLNPYLDDSGLQNEAALAIVQIAPALKASDAPAIKTALQKISATIKNDEIRNQAAKLLADLK